MRKLDLKMETFPYSLLAKFSTRPESACEPVTPLSLSFTHFPKEKNLRNEYNTFGKRHLSVTGVFLKVSNEKTHLYIF
jgi:hypothetical protein